MKKAVHEILDIKFEPLFYDPSVNFEVCTRNQSEFLQNPKFRLTSKERVEFVFKFINFNVDLTNNPNKREKFNKNSSVARKLRERGNEFYKKKEFATAMVWYNLAMLFAPAGDQELGLAYANRSIVLLKLGHPEEALADVELALVNNYPKPPVLESRRKKCLEMIGQKNESRKDEDHNLRTKVEEETRERQKMRKEMLRIRNPNPKIPEAADFVTIMYDEVMGRKLVVTRDVPAGTVLMVSEPYMTVLNKTEGWDPEHCHNCLKRIRRGIPCENCVFAFYCNELCKQEAYEEYHKFECPCMDYLHGEDQEWVLAFRVVCKAGPKKLFQLYRNQDPSYFNPKKPYGVAEDCKFNEDPYLAVYHMMAHSDKFDEGEYTNARKTYSAVVLALILELRSAFFREIPERQRADFMKFVATLIRHHIDSVNINPTPIFEMRGSANVSLVDFYTKGSDVESLSQKIKSSELFDFALGMYPLDSLKNHSCDPNVFYVHDGSKGRKITVASRELHAGDVIYGNYGVIFIEHPLEYRQHRLREKFHFTCQCVACVNHWPTVEQAQRGASFGVPQFCCPACSVNYSTMQKTSAEFKKKCGLNEAGSWKCSSCGKQYSGQTLRLLNTLNVMVLEVAGTLRNSNRPRDALPKLLEAIDYFQTHLVPPSHFMTLVEQEYCRALSLVFLSLSP